MRALSFVTVVLSLLISQLATAQGFVNLPFLRSVQGAEMRTIVKTQTYKSFSATANYGSTLYVFVAEHRAVEKEIEVYRHHSCFSSEGLRVGGKSFTEKLELLGLAGSSELVFGSEKEFLLSYEDASLEIRCQTELSFIIDGQWQFDPINGTTLFLIQHF